MRGFFWVPGKKKGTLLTLKQRVTWQTSLCFRFESELMSLFGRLSALESTPFHFSICQGGFSFPFFPKLKQCLHKSAWLRSANLKKNYYSIHFIKNCRICKSKISLIFNDSLLLPFISAPMPMPMFQVCHGLLMRGTICSWLYYP